MGNCLKTPTADDISLLRGSDSPTEGNDSSSLGPPPPYQVSCEKIMIVKKGIETLDFRVILIFGKKVV